MKKLLSLLVLILFVVVAPNVLAVEESKILSMEAKENTSGVITVTGTTKEEVIAVSASIYDESGKFVKVVHGQVNDDNTYSITIEAAPQKYVVRAADYNGGAYLEVTVEPNDETVTSKNAKTGDFIHIYVIVGIVALIGLFGTVFYLKKIK